MDNVQMNMTEDDIRVSQTLYASVECVMILNTSKESYKIVKIPEKWKARFNDGGSLHELYSKLFSYQKEEGIEESSYSIFNNKDIFMADKYQGRIEFIEEGKSVYYGITILKMNDEESSLCINSIDDSVASDSAELQKIDVIQEDYLFSMIADLAEDACINPNTTEVSATRQDYMNIKYSDWRMMISNMFQENDRPIFMRMSSPEYIINNLEEQHSFGLELQMMNMTGKYIWVRLNFARTPGFSRKHPRFVYTVRDIQKDMERMLNQENIIKAVEEQNKKLKESEQERTKFFSNMSHEIRTPINAILGMNEVILRESTEENIKKYANDIKSSSRYLLSIVNDILDVSKIQAGKMEIIPVEYNLIDVIKEVNIMIRSRIQAKNLKYYVKMDNDLPKRLYGDDIRLKQIIINLLTNAVKYTREGKVELLIDSDKTKDGAFALKVSVKDTGIGIKPEDMDNLMKEYSRLDNKINRRVEGTGLGMSIVTGLLEQMDGELSINSVYGEGSEFTFVLPQKIVEVEGDFDKEAVRNFDVSGKKVLIVDDIDININVVKALMKPYAVDIDSANSGEMCLDMVKDKSYDIIFLDHMMPGLDGVETLKNIKQLGQTYSNIPVIALTGNSSASARSEYVGLGFNDYLEKPVTPDKLDNIIKTYLAKL